MDIAFRIATHSYCSRFGGRRFARPGRNVRGVTTHAEGKKEGHEEEGQEGEEEEIRNVDSVNVCASGRSRVLRRERRLRRQRPRPGTSSDPPVAAQPAEGLHNRASARFFLPTTHKSVYG